MAHVLKFWKERNPVNNFTVQIGYPINREV